MKDESAETSDLMLLRQQEPNAFSKLVRDHEPIVVGLCRAMGLRGADREDAAADAFGEVYRALPQFDGRSSVSTWVYRIASRAIWRAREFRAKRSHGQLREDTADRARNSPAEIVEKCEDRKRLWSAVATLESRQATAVELFYGHDCSVDEVAEILACPVGTVKTLLYQARNRLREMLKTEDSYV